MSENDPLMPTPTILKVAGKEIRIAPLPNRKLLEVVKYVRDNYGVLEKLSGMGQPSKEGEPSLDDIVEKDVLPKLNELVRMVSKNKDLDDDWCFDHLGPAHYKAIGTAFLKQNEAYDLFVWAKGFMGANMAQALRQAMGATQTLSETEPDLMPKA